MVKLGIYTALPNSIPKLSHPYRGCLISKRPCLPHHPNVTTENLYPVTHFHLEFIFFNNISCQNITSDLTIVDSTTSNIFEYPNRSKRLPLQIIEIFVQFSRHHGYKISILQVDEGSELSRLEYFMKLCIDHEYIVKTTGGYESSFDRK